MNRINANLTVLLCLLSSFLTNATYGFSTRNHTSAAQPASDTIRSAPDELFRKGILANAPPVLSATGDQLYCPGTALFVVTDMTITDPDDTGTFAVYIQISSGYQITEDLLALTGSHPAINALWDAAAGKLTLTGSAATEVSYTDFIAAIKQVVYTNNDPNANGSRTFSISIGEANYLASTGHYYQFVPALGITWSDARAVAETSTYYGLQGYLATIAAADEAQLSGEQAAGAGWIGGSDEAAEGVWKWVTGPENGTVFWNGGVAGSSPNFAFWNNGEPNNAENENYAHITAPGVGIPGSWNDLSNTGGTSGNYQPKGYIVEYGGMPGDPVLNISTSTTLTIPTIQSSSTASICGPGTVTISAVSDSGTVNWYAAPAGGTVLATGPSFTTPPLTATTTYYVAAAGASCPTAARVPVAAVVFDVPVLTVAPPAASCTGVVTLQATTTIGQISWYASATGTELALAS